MFWLRLSYFQGWLVFIIPSSVQPYPLEMRLTCNILKVLTTSFTGCSNVLLNHFYTLFILFFCLLPMFLPLSSKSDTDISKRPGPPPVRPKPVRPKWKVSENKEAKYRPISFEPIHDTTVITKVQFPLTEPTGDKFDTKMTELEITAYNKQKPLKTEFDTSTQVGWRTQFETEGQQSKMEISMAKPHPKLKIEPRVTQKTLKDIQIEASEPEQEYMISFEIPEPKFTQRKVTKTTTEIRRESSRSETNMVILEGMSDDSDAAFFRKTVTIKKLLPPTPEKFIIEGDLYPEKPRKSKRVRVRKQKPKSKYEPVPYISGPTIFWVPERTDVLQAAEAWAR